MDKRVPKVSKDERAILYELTKDLEATADQVNKSLIEFAQIKTEIRHLVDMVKELRGGDGSGPIVTRIALVEQSLKEVKRYISRDTQSGTDMLTRLAVLEEKTHRKSPLSIDNKGGKWKFYGIVAAGGFTFLSSLASMLMHLLGN